MGYGVALQASCLEGFDSLGLHQFSKVFIQQITKFNFYLKIKRTLIYHGPLAHSGERYPVTVEARGSKPLWSARRGGSALQQGKDVEVVDFGASPI